MATTNDGYCNCDLEMFGKHVAGCTRILRPKPKPLESYTMETWRAEAVKNWMAALADIYEIQDANMTPGESKFVCDAAAAIMLKVRQILDIDITDG